MRKKLFTLVLTVVWVLILVGTALAGREGVSMS